MIAHCLEHYVTFGEKKTFLVSHCKIIHLNLATFVIIIDFLFHFLDIA